MVHNEVQQAREQDNRQLNVGENSATSVIAGQPNRGQIITIGAPHSMCSQMV